MSRFYVVCPGVPTTCAKEQYCPGFQHYQLTLFNVAVLNIEGDNATIVTTENLKLLTQKPQTRKENRNLLQLEGQVKG